MKRTHFCPACQATLNPNVKPILTMARGGRRSLILLSPTCDVNLRGEVNEHSREIGFRLEGGTKGRVNLSRRYGEHATHFVTKEQVRCYGENAAVYAGANFFGAGGKGE